MQHHHAQQGYSQPAMLILASLSQGPKHAVALCEAIEQTEGLFFEPGTLYRVLAHLEQRGLIEALATEHPLRLYSITVLGMLAFERADASRQGEKLREGGRPLLLGGKEIIMRLVLWMLRLYPPSWRERYETEMAALLEQHGRSKRFNRPTSKTEREQNVLIPSFSPLGQKGGKLSSV